MKNPNSYYVSRFEDFRDATALKRITEELAQGDLFLGHNA